MKVEREERVQKFGLEGGGGNGLRGDSGLRWDSGLREDTGERCVSPNIPESEGVLSEELSNLCQNTLAHAHNFS